MARKPLLALVPRQIVDIVEDKDLRSAVIRGTIVHLQVVAVAGPCATVIGIGGQVLGPSVGHADVEAPAYLAIQSHLQGVVVAGEFRISRSDRGIAGIRPKRAEVYIIAGGGICGIGSGRCSEGGWFKSTSPSKWVPRPPT